MEEDWAKNLRNTSIQIDGSHVSQAARRVEMLSVAQELSRRIDRQNPIINEFLHKANKISVMYEKELEKLKQNMKGEKSDDDESGDETTGKKKSKKGDEPKKVKRVKPNPNYPTALLNLYDHGERIRPVDNNICYENYEMWSRKSVRLETLFRQRNKDLVIDSLPNLSVINILKEGVVINMFDVVIADLEHDDDQAYIQRLTSSDMEILRQVSSIIL
jgi:hypothetical protein